MRHAVWVGAVASLVAGGPVAAQDRKPEVIAKLEGHLGGVSALAFHPKAPYLATGAGNGVFRLWGAKSGLVARIDPDKASGGRVSHIGFSASGLSLSTSSRNGVTVWDLYQPPPPKLPIEPKTDSLEPKKDGSLAVKVLFEDSLGTDPAKIGTVTGDGRRVFLASSEGVRIAVNSKVFSSQLGSDTVDELKGVFTPKAVAAVSDPESALVAMYGTVKAADKTEQSAVAFVGVGDGRVVGRGVVPPVVAGRPVSVGFAPDGKWLVACNGESLVYWRVPGSQVVEGDPKPLADSPAYTAAAGPNGRVAFASPPEDGKTVKVTVVDLSGPQPKVAAVYATEIARVSALAFSPDGATLAVGDDTEGVVQVWNLDVK